MSTKTNDVEPDVVCERSGATAASSSEPRVTAGRSAGASGRPCDSPLVPPGLAVRVEKLRADFEEVTGAPFEHLVCPILYRDEPVELCRGHVVNRAFEGAPRAWTVQRKDVDNHFGSRFESGFTVLSDFDKVVAEGGLGETDLPPHFKTRVLAGGQEVPHFSSKKWPGAQFTGLHMVDSKRTIFLKKTPEEVDRIINERWCIETTADLRVPAAVSLIKSAHLTLFALLGYRYALSCGGCLVGGDVLGRIFRETISCPPGEAEGRARTILGEWVHMVRPLLGGSWLAMGTVEDRSLLVAWTGSGYPWAAIVSVPLGGSANYAVMLPCSSRLDDLATYLDFLRNDQEEIRVKLARLEPGREQFIVSEWDYPLRWPKRGETFDLRSPVWPGEGK
ncbi:MAG: hypothetical protein F4210_08910 [Holophagales bacterium]|nr:hypothetical protein [Holophagales bacterium]MYF95612.1 hypothetical protein [Holophagales bacterium]